MIFAIKGVSEAGSVAPVEVPVIIDNPFAPEILATGFTGFANIGGMIVLTLESSRCDHSRPAPTVERVVVGRIALTVHAAQRLVASLNDFLEEQGMSPSRAIAGGSTFQ
jgi:hypothetical protein